MSNKKKIAQLVLLVFLAFLVFGHVANQTALSEENDFIMEEGIVYGKVDDVELKLDLARPTKGRVPFPALVFIHGHGQDKKAYSEQIKIAAKNGYVAVTVDFRSFVSRENGKAKYPFPAQVQDVKCAVPLCVRIVVVSR
jgi:acetyl esterase/lipase